jgi:hypothetical protein
MLGNVVTVDASKARALAACVPMPRYVFGGCCIDRSHASNTTQEGHAATMLASHSKLRNILKTKLVKKKDKGMWVLDVLGSLTKKTSIDAQIGHLRTLTDINNVHLTSDRYKAIAGGILEACKNLANT